MDAQVVPLILQLTMFNVIHAPLAIVLIQICSFAIQLVTLLPISIGKHINAPTVKAISI